jgi:site-specific recombinase XerC
MCSSCGGPVDRNGRYCRACHNAYMREWRKTHPQSEAEKRKSNTRAYTNVLVKRGQLTKAPCRDCEAEKVQAHHPDYGQPRLVVWLCQSCHRAEHTRLRET